MILNIDADFDFGKVCFFFLPTNTGFSFENFYIVCMLSLKPQNGKF